MHPLLRLFVRTALIFLVVFVVVQPYNWFCQITRNCSPIFFSYYIPKKEGAKKINVAFEVTNYRGDLDFSAFDSGLVTVGNRKNETIFQAKNLSNRAIKFRPSLEVEPAYFEKYLTRYECPCSREYLLANGETANLKMAFEIDRSFEKDPNFSKEDSEQNIKITYKIR